MAYKESESFAEFRRGLTEVFAIRHGYWNAIWRGRTSTADFNSKGAAQAWIASCDAAGRWRA